MTGAATDSVECQTPSSPGCQTPSSPGCQTPSSPGCQTPSSPRCQTPSSPLGKLSRCRQLTARGQVSMNDRSSERLYVRLLAPLLLLLLALSGCRQGSDAADLSEIAADPLTIVTDSGPIVGVEEQGVRVFRISPMPLLRSVTTGSSRPSRSSRGRRREMHRSSVRPAHRSWQQRATVSRACQSTKTV